MNRKADELWEFYKTVDSSIERFRTHYGIPFTYKLTNSNLIIIYCEDEFGSEEKCYFTKSQFLEVANLVINEKELLDKAVYIRKLQNLDFSKNIVDYLLPIVHYIAEFFLNRTENYKIVDDVKEDEKVEEENQDQNQGNAFVIEIALEDEIPVNEIEELSNCKKIRFHPRMESYYKKTSDKIRAQIDDVCKMFSQYQSDECSKFLRQSNNKRLTGSKKKIDKIYMNRHSSGHRLLWCKGEDIDSTRFNGEIILLDYVEEHDEQGKVANRMKMLNVDYSKAVNLANSLADEVQKGFDSSIPPYKYKNGLLFPVLSDKQLKIVKAEPPILLLGGAGTGKTQVSIYLFEQLYNAKKKPLYITFTDALTRNVREQLIHIGCDEKFVYSHVFKLTDYFKYYSSKIEYNAKIIEFNDFVKWRKTIIYKKSENDIKEVDDWLAWTYIRGVIKGGAVELRERFLSKTVFLKWMKKNENISYEVSNAIYELAERFDKFCKDNKYLDDNDLAWEVLDNKILSNEDALIIDEVQDLTYLHINVLKNVVNNGDIYMCGDINQRINPTIIDLNSLGKIFFDKKSYKMQVLSLGNSYRVGNGIIRFVNELSYLRREYIGKQDAEAEVLEKSSRDRDQGMWVNTCDSSKITIEELCDLISDSANSIILVPNNAVKLELMNIRPKMEGQIRTIFEVKGLEYDNVIMMNFISDYQLVFDHIFAEHMKRNTYARLLFNMLYVGATRAKDRLIIFEKNNECLPEKIILKSAIIKDSIEDISRFIYLKNDDEGWKNEAIRLEEIEDYRSALLALEHIQNYDVRSDTLRCSLLYEYEEMRRNNSKITWLDVYDLVQKLMDINCYSEAKRIIQEISVLNEANRTGLALFMLEILHKNNDKIKAEHMIEAFDAGLSKDESKLVIVNEELKKVLDYNENLLNKMHYCEV